ncbi:hypothetical protein [Rubrimonas cliftonensis]|uniref:Uncharacterized protein n=1 Tax=Rubrimonas cliftonensis TaxID=89524 RepID=A0A1H4F512_9RHOB|nr:hypothetical protein [Rubrimonas cliftonensis]SEA92017.1 hypothetical protein SAMN05444370_11831 [Rubrimonas cliftonensis]
MANAPDHLTEAAADLAVALALRRGALAGDRWMLAAPYRLPQPHHVSGTIETRRDMVRPMRENLAAHLTGRPIPATMV